MTWKEEQLNVAEGLQQLLVPAQCEPTGCHIYFQIISIISLFMFRAGLKVKGRWAGSSTLKLLSLLYPTPWK
jgi:hypothetical protein